jgi:hypothetical protein
MAVLPEDIKYYESLEADSLGGGISAAIVPTGLNLYYDDVPYQEATDGSTAYRCFYVKNTNATDTLGATVIYIEVRTNNPSTACELGLGSSGLNGTEQVITGENISPVGVTFFSTSQPTPLPIGDLLAGEYYPIWIKRIVNSEATGVSVDSVTLAVDGDGGV